MSAMSDFTAGYVRREGFKKYQMMTSLMALVASAMESANAREKQAIAISVANLTEGLEIAFDDFKQMMELSRTAAAMGEDPNLSANAALDAALGKAA